VTTTSGPGPLTSRSIRRIGLWGAPGSGKTTFLAALNVAVTRSKQDLLIYGSDDEATDFLAENTSMLTTQRRFPPATEQLRPLSWAMHLPVQRASRTRLGRRSMETGTLQLNIDLLDAPGGTFRSVPSASTAGGGDNLLFDEEDGEAPGAPEEELIDHLAGCDGIVFLFDPIRERTNGDAYEYFQGTLLRIAQRRLSQGGEVRPKLPQYLAVCITKLDDPDVYRQAKRKGYRSFDENDPYLFPRVSDDSAEQFFAELCRGTDVGNADLVSGAIRQFFMPDRVKYFITSAIGFYVGSATRFREQDYQNAVPDSDGVVRIRGPIFPINVVEPLLWLGRSLTSAGS
jgi:energy-coupling factor transporter ATP-binding protein EcfA2